MPFCLGTSRQAPPWYGLLLLGSQSLGGLVKYNLCPPAPCSRAGPCPQPPVLPIVYHPANPQPPASLTLELPLDLFPAAHFPQPPAPFGAPPPPVAAPPAIEVAPPASVDPTLTALVPAPPAWSAPVPSAPAPSAPTPLALAPPAPVLARRRGRVAVVARELRQHQHCCCFSRIATRT